jgi:diguanylate cyclase (GGDEF)-like protein
MASRLRDPVLIVATAVLLGVGALAFRGASAWLDQPFPGFLVLENRVVASAGLSRWPAIEGGEIYQLEVVALEGRPLENVAPLWEAARSAAPETPLRYTLRSDGSIPTRSFDRVDFALLFGAYLLNGIVMGAVALTIRALRGPHPLANATVPLLFVSALWGLSAMDLYGPYHLFRLHALCEVLLFPTAVHMALGFPQRARLLVRHPWILGAVYGLAGVLAVANQLWLRDPAGYVVTHGLATLALGCGLAILIVSQMARFFASPSFEARQRIKLLALGTTVALAPLVFLTLSAAWTGGRSPQNAIAFTAFLFPLAIGYATIRHNLLDVDVLIRRSLSYAVLTAIVTGVYSGSIAGMEAVFHASEVERSAGFAAAFAAFTVLVLLPLRNEVQSRVDRIFFRSSYDAQRIIEATSRRLAAVTDLEVIAEELVHGVEGALSPEAVVFLARRDKEQELVTVREVGAGDADVEAALTLAEIASDAFDLEDGGLAVPLRTESLLVGVLVLRRRGSGRVYGGDDRRFLQTLANQGAVAVRNALTLGHLRELNRDLEAQVDRRTLELSQALEELEERNEALRELSATDSLTGLRTRRSLMEFLDREFARIRRHGGSLALAVLDLDHFKQVNDRFGHLVGDEALRLVGEIVRRDQRATDLAARYGGEEIVLVISDSDLEAAHIRAERVRMAIEQTPLRRGDGTRVNLTVSVGVAVVGPQHQTVEALIAAADDALYRAKQRGRNRVEVA